MTMDLSPHISAECVIILRRFLSDRLLIRSGIWTDPITLIISLFSISCHIGVKPCGYSVRASSGLLISWVLEGPHHGFEWMELDWRDIDGQLSDHGIISPLEVADCQKAHLLPRFCQVGPSDWRPQDDSGIHGVDVLGIFGYIDPPL